MTSVFDPADLSAQLQSQLEAVAQLQMQQNAPSAVQQETSSSLPTENQPQVRNDTNDEDPTKEKTLYTPLPVNQEGSYKITSSEDDLLETNNEEVSPVTTVPTPLLPSQQTSMQPTPIPSAVVQNPAMPLQTPLQTPIAIASLPLHQQVGLQQGVSALTSEALSSFPPQQAVQQPVQEKISPELLNKKVDPEKTFDIIVLLTKALALDCSDVFIKADAPPMAKVLGRLIALDDYILTDYSVEKLAQSLMSEKQSVRFSENQELDMSFYLAGKGRFRVSIYRQRGSVAMVLRRIKSVVPTIDQLHLPPVLNELVMQKRGLILVTGAAGSGKTSTLAAMLDHRNTHSSGHILTIEDPIEFLLMDQGCIVSQREIDVDTLSWDNALKGSMRQAPDVILIGEMRDTHSATVAMNLAETGHLVLSTIHSSNTLQTLERFVSMFPREMHEELHLRLSMSLVGIISQRLVKTVDGQERYPALEVLITTPRIKDLIRKGEITSIREVIATSRNFGMVTFDQSLFDLWKQGTISEEEALNNADSPNNLQLMMKGITYAETT